MWSLGCFTLLFDGDSWGQLGRDRQHTEIVMSGGERVSHGSYVEWNEDEETTSNNSKTIEQLIETIIERNSVETVPQEDELSSQFYSIVLPIFFNFFVSLIYSQDCVVIEENYVCYFCFFCWKLLFSIIPLTYQVIIEQTCKDLQSDDCSDSEVSGITYFLLYC